MKYGAILIDPPVAFRVWNDANKQKSAAAHYNLMTWDDLASIGPAIDAVALPDACLFMWVCSPLIPETLSLVQGWGWIYKTVAFVWVKTTQDRLGMAMNLGYWTRANAEQVWLFTRGRVTRRSKGVYQALHTEETPAVVTYPGRHSAKPEEVQTRIERMIDGPYLELFARRRRDGWTTIGNELDGLDIRDSLARLAADEPLPRLESASLFDLDQEQPSQNALQGL